ncbi:MAG TPA: HYR domain-containing protein [Cellulomonas sp.]|uniref:HYR domain-containing protein n=1 Tax=Cellulomonas sp. TaxID=40001 RepID=UPI002E373FA7|nr:HYR domain-containing protein [Cellulomonas sp.]HEX5333378.1 HYR domain-containing protein [Cellulomonas sp.]
MKLSWRVGATMLAVAAVVAVPVPALADTVTVTNAVVAGDGSKSVWTDTGVGVSVSYTLAADNNPVGDLQGCNAQTKPGGGVTVTILPVANVTASPSALIFTDCSTAKSVTFSASSPGDFSVTASATGGKTGSLFTTAAANFTLHVVSPNQPPTVTVTGVLQGASYEHGSVPAAMCNVTDDHDAARTFAATLSAIAGTLTSYGLGSQTAACSATDTGGLTSTTAAAYTVVDTTKPTLTVPGDLTAEATGSSGAVVTWSASATDAVDGSPAVACSGTGGLTSGTTFPLGATLVGCTATDVAGNQDTKQFQVTVQDTTPPLLTLPPSSTTEATGPNGASVTYSASATDSVDGAITPTCTPASATTFGITTTTVGCTATDARANQVQGLFSVTVQDTTAPTLTLPTVAPHEATGPSGATLTYAATASDVVDVTVSVTCDYPTGSVFQVGDTTVSCTATDAHGNTTPGNFTVTVTDTTGPVLTLPGDISEEATKSTGSDIAYSVLASDLVDGSVATSCDPANGTFAIGTTTVTCTATDAHANATTGSFTVTVVDTTAPVLSAGPGDQTLEAASADGTVATFASPTAVDLVDGDRAVSCASGSGLGSGSTFPLGTTTVTCVASDTRGNASDQTFIVTVADTIAPLVGVLENITPEATGPDGAVVSFTAPTATDAVSGSPTVTCDPTSGSTFAIDTVATITCSATDSAHNTGSSTFTIVVHDSTGPALAVPGNITEEATSPDGATASWAGVSATDLVDGPLPASCDPTSGSVFHLGDATVVTCTAYDVHHNKGVGGFTVTVLDRTAPALVVSGDTTLEATAPSGAPATFTATATDLVDGAVTPTCTAGGDPVASGVTFPLGNTTVTCSAADAHGNISPSQSFTVTVQDTTRPTVTVPVNMTLEATSANGAQGTYASSAADLVDGTLTPTCAPAAGATFPLGLTTVTCTATDAHANTATGSFTVTVVDTTAPVVSVPANIATLATSAAGAVVTFAAPTATDAVGGSSLAVCAPPSGSLFKPGETVVTCTATDVSGNSAARTFKVTVRFDWTGFFAPVDNAILNGMKAGSTAPMKWQISNQAGGYVSDLTIVSKTTSGVAMCSTGALVDDLEVYATGGTQLRYDSTAHQFIYNWQSPKKPGTCYTITIGLTDGTSHSATFQLK